MTDRSPIAPLPDDVGLLFIGGCPRTGTTALQEYLNVHPQLMIGRERYKWTPPASITRDDFEIDALLEFDPEMERYRTETRLKHMKRIIADKEVTELRWVGDKYPGYLEHLSEMSQNNPGAKFMVTHRDVTPVVNSYVGRSKNPDDSWLGGRDVLDLAIRTWNRSVRQLHDALLTPQLDILPVPYESFFASPEEWLDRIGRFLAIDMPSEVGDEWKKRSATHSDRGGTSNHLGPKELARIEEMADRRLEAETIALIDRKLGIAAPSLWDRLRSRTGRR